MGVTCEGGVCRLDAAGDHQAGAAGYTVPKDSPLALLAVDELGGDSSVSGGVLEDEHGREVDPSVLEGKLVGLYFSAGWCPPCRSFSPVLADFARFHKEDFVVVFVSSDHTEQDMQAYVSGKGFMRVRWPCVGVRRQLQAYLGVSMLPTLAICDAGSGAVLTTWGRVAVMMNSRNCLSDWRRGRSGMGVLSMLGLGGPC